VAAVKYFDTYNNIKNSHIPHTVAVSISPSRVQPNCLYLFQRDVLFLKVVQN
jgi:hypothetical protein